MPTLYVIYDPRDRVNGLNQEEAKHIGASVASMSINTEEIETETIQDTAEKLTALLLSAIARDQQ